MSFHDLFDPLFLLPFVNGLLLAVLLPLLGAWIRLREEWLAALGLAQVAAAGVVVGAIFMEPVGLVALAAAALAAAAKALLGRAAGNDAYAIMILLGWSGGLIGASFAAHGDELGRALVQGQIYFTGPGHLQGIGSSSLPRSRCCRGCRRACCSAASSPTTSAPTGSPTRTTTSSSTSWWR